MLKFQFSSVTQSCLTLCDPWTAACQASQSITTPRVYSNLCPLSRWCHTTISSSVIPFSSCLQSFQHQGLSHLCIRWPMYWSFSISPVNEYSGLISFRIDRFDPWNEKIPWKRTRQPIPVLAWRIPWTEDPGAWRAMVHKVWKSQTWLKQLSVCVCPWLYSRNSHRTMKEHNISNVQDSWLESLGVSGCVQGSLFWSVL